MSLKGAVANETAQRQSLVEWAAAHSAAATPRRGDSRSYSLLAGQVSQRKTPSLASFLEVNCVILRVLFSVLKVGFTDRERLLGDSALSQIKLAPEQRAGGRMQRSFTHDISNIQYIYIQPY